MATNSDPLSPPQPPNRVYYSLGRMLGVEDFQADQSYHRGRLARALLQMCGTGTVSGLKVQLPQYWQPNTPYAAWAFIVDPSKNIQVNTGLGGVSGNTQPAWPATAGNQTSDGGLTWTNEGPIIPNDWKPNTVFNSPSIIKDPNGNLQLLNGTTSITTGLGVPLWNQTVGGVTPDGTNPAAWTCLGASDLEFQVTPGLAIDRVGRMIEVPRTVCIRIEPWLQNQTASDLNLAIHGTSSGPAIIVDVFATFVGCTRGVTPCFATQDDYDATDAFSPNRLLDSFAMQLVLRTDATPQTPQDPWLATGALPTTSSSPTSTQSLQQNILDATTGPGNTAPFGAGPIPVEYPPGFDASAIFLARIQIAATQGAGGQRPTWDLTKVSIDNFSRLFLYPASLVARWSGLSSGTQS